MLRKVSDMTPLYLTNRYEGGLLVEGKPRLGEALPTKLTDALRPGDEVWRYHTSPESWRHLCGRAGLVIVRNGKLVYEYELVYN